MSDTGDLKRSLESRHLTMIAIGGALGTGLFLASGGVISGAGPGGGLVAYAIMSVMVYFLMTSLGEMAAYMPVAGSFETYATRFVDPALGFALGWNYWINWAVTLAAEISAAAIIMQFWFPGVSGLLWSALFFVALFVLNALSARAYGEGEFWFAGIKVTTVLIFLVCGVLAIFGIIGGHAVGCNNWVTGEAPFVGGWPAILSVLMIAGFSFQGTELVGIAAGESNNPSKNIPTAIKTVFWRIVIFYIGAITIIGFLLPYTDPNLLRSGLQDVAVSPFTLVFKHSGLTFAADVMNAVILTAILSAGNASMYASTRMLYALSKEGKAPKIFGVVNKRSVPFKALVFTSFVAALCFFTSLLGEGVIYTWLVNLSGLLGFIAWLGIAISHYRFRKAFYAQKKSLDCLPYKAKFFPFGPLFAFALCMLVMLGQNYRAFMGDTIDWLAVTSTYCSLPVFIGCYVGYKLYHKTKVVALDEVDLRPFDRL